MLVLVALTMSMLAAVGFERLSYRWCPWMGAVWTSACCDGARDADDEDDAQSPAISSRCCERRHFKALPSGEPERSRTTSLPPIDMAPLTSVTSAVGTRPAAAHPRTLVVSGVPPPSMQQRLAALSRYTV